MKQLKMERIRKRKLKFSCLFGGNDETWRRRSVLSCSPANTSTEFKFEVGRSTSKTCSENQVKKLLTKGTSNGFSAKKRSPSVLSKLMGIGRCSSKNVKIVERSSEKYRKNKELVCTATECKWRGSNAIETVPEISSQVGLYGYGYYGDESLHLLRSESEEITMPSRIIFGQHDRLTHSLSRMSESSLIREATNRMLERWNTTHIKEDGGTVSKVTVLGELMSSPSVKETKPAEPDNVTDLVAVNYIFASPTGLGAILGDRDIDGQGDRHCISTSSSLSLSSSCDDPNYKRIVYHEDDADEDPAKYQPSISDIEADAADAQLSVPESEDEAFHSDCFESVNSRLQDLKKNIHLLKKGITLVSKKPALIPKVKYNGQQSSNATPESVSPESACITHILQTLESYATNPDASSPPHPIDPRLFYLLEKYYFEGTARFRNEKRLCYDYIEQMFIRTSNSKLAYPWVNPVKIKGQLMLPELNLKDQIGKVVDEIEKDEDENFCEIYYDKDSEWVLWTKEIDILGKLVAELVLNDLLLEVVDV